jgi:hypothetical protein
MFTRWCAAGLLIVATTAAHAEPARIIRYRDDALTVRVSGVRTAEVLAEIARQGGLEIRGEPRLARHASADFDAIPLREALTRLLDGQNFTLTYGEGGKLRAIELLGTTATDPSTRTSPETAPPALRPEVLEVVRRSAPVPIDGRLAEALSSRSATVEQLMDACLHQQDPAVRAEAVRAGMTALDDQPELRAVVLSSLGAVDDARVGAMLRGMAGSRANEILRRAASGADAVELRAKAWAVLEQMPRTPSGK